mgnify:CR=1 FL=1
MDNTSSINFTLLEKAIGYHFNDRSLLTLALCHSSNSQNTGMSNERLEFLGDAVISIVISEYLYRSAPDANEGKLSKLRSSAVSTAALAEASRLLDLKSFALTGKSLGNVSLSDSVHANLFESVAGALFLDGGIANARIFVCSALKGYLDQLISRGPEVNYKSLLQITLQKNGNDLPTYKVVSCRGENHNRIFDIRVILNGRTFEAGSGSSKKEAEQDAARKCLKAMGKLQ